MTFSRLVTGQLKCVFLLFLLTGSGIAVAAEAQQTTTDGLELVSNSELAVVYVKPAADLSQYRRIYLEDASVAFKKNWQRSRNSTSVSKRVSSSDMSRIKSDLATLFRDVFTQTLEDGGYTLVGEIDEDVLLMKPAIINLDIVAPDTRSGGHSQTFAESAGELTLYLELYDSVSGELLARAVDRQKDRQTGYISWQNRVSNRAAARRILQLWADVLKQGLDTAYSKQVTEQVIP